MATVGPTICGTGANDSSNGAGAAWTNPGNITTEDASFATVANVNPGSSFYYCGVTGCELNYIRLLKGGTPAGTAKTPYTCMPSSSTWQTYGGATDKWGTTWTDTDINGSTFGSIFTFDESKFNTVMTNYLKATNFGFSIPGGSTIDGITVEVKCHADTTPSTGSVYVDAVRVTVNYTAGAAPSSQTAILIGAAF